MSIIKRIDIVYRNPMRTAFTEYGAVAGIPGGNYICIVFKGIPYAKPPIGDLRFRKPALPEPWEGVRGCLKFGAAAAQLDRSYEISGKNNYPTPYKISEDCLYLNI